MKHQQADKYTIAWFKIAEYVSRGEKERALGVYRLLSHSFNDDAVARQLEADIYLLCNEQVRAVELYRQAIECFVKTKRFLQVAAVLEHLITLLPKDSVLRHDAIRYYVLLGNGVRIQHHTFALIENYKVCDDDAMATNCLENTLTVLLETGYEKELRSFLSALSIIDEDLYTHACDYIKK